ncbi:MAG: LptF/LptG family permease [Prevotella sp.]|nr:LptF/LptG family permease [Prevotella sp.]
MLGIKRLDIFIAKQFGLLFVATFFICQFVLMMQFLWRYIDDLIGKGLTMDVLAQFFWYMALMLVPQAFPLAILLSSLITYGNLGESSELTAIKAAGISLLQSMRSIIIIVILITGVSIYFQEKIGPDANKNLAQLLISMKQKSPELEIPEGVFYDGIPNTNLYVQKKDLTTGKLYGMMIYRQSGSYEDQAIILADSGMIQSTAEKKHLLLTLWSGEWFENIKQQDMVTSAEVPYRRETFAYKQILLDFDGEFNLADASTLSGNAKAKSSKQILHDLDSIRIANDSVGHRFYWEARQYCMAEPRLTHDDSLRMAVALDQGKQPNVDSIFSSLNGDMRREVTKNAARQAQTTLGDVAMKAEMAKYNFRQERMHEIELIGKYTLALSCIIFFFIGAPLGAIIRKGGLGLPVIISVLVFIVYYIFENSGMRMARDDNWTVWFGKGISTMVLAPLAVFFTYKANNDSTVFNMDAYRLLIRRMLGLRMKRNIVAKEVIINDPDYRADSLLLLDINAEIDTYSQEHHLLRWPNPIKVFFRPGDDRQIIDISERLETVIDDLSNSREKQTLHLLNQYPVLATHAHTRPFRQRWLNALTGIILPLGIFFYIRMLRFRLRLYKDLKTIEKTSNAIIETHPLTPPCEGGEPIELLSEDNS